MNGLSTSSSSLSSSSTSSKDSKNAKSGKKLVKMGAEKIWENRHHIPYWPSWLTPKKGQTKPKQSSAKSYYSRVPLKVQSRVPKRNTTMVSTPQVLVQPKRQSHSVELLEALRQIRDNQYHCSQRFNNPISRPPRTNRNEQYRLSYPPSPSLSGETKFPPLLEQYQQFSAPMPIPLRRQR